MFIENHATTSYAVLARLLRAHVVTSCHCNRWAQCYVHYFWCHRPSLIALLNAMSFFNFIVQNVWKIQRFALHHLRQVNFEIWMMYQFLCTLIATPSLDADTRCVLQLCEYKCLNNYAKILILNDVMQIMLHLCMYCTKSIICRTSCTNISKFYFP